VKSRRRLREPSERRGSLPGDEIAAQAEFGRRIAKIEQKIAQKLESHTELNILTRAGLEKKALFKMLALAVYEQGNKSWASLMRTKQEALKSIARRMKTIARDAERRAADPFSHIQTWFFLAAYGGKLGMEWPQLLASDPCFPLLISGMRLLAQSWTVHARKFGRFLDRFGDVRTNEGVPLFLCWVCIRLRKSKPVYWPELATILTDAFGANGVQKSFSADWLQKLWRKRGRHMLGFWLEHIANGLRPGALPSSHIPGLVD
jgi:hypothetical protein